MVMGLLADGGGGCEDEESAQLEMQSLGCLKKEYLMGTVELVELQT